jgi:hypothetical protein
MSNIQNNPITIEPAEVSPEAAALNIFSPKFNDENNHVITNASRGTDISEERSFINLLKTEKTETS